MLAKTLKALLLLCLIQAARTVAARLSAAYPRHRRITPMALFALRTPETPDSVPTP